MESIIQVLKALLGALEGLWEGLVNTYLYLEEVILMFLVENGLVSL